MGDGLYHVAQVGVLLLYIIYKTIITFLSTERGVKLLYITMERDKLLYIMMVSDGNILFYKKYFFV
jgi:hypothetical protein